jgi:flagellar assembly protein FliH
MSGLTAWERWELNSFDSKEEAGAHDEAQNDAEAVAQLPTAAEVDQIRQSAQEEGYAAGYAAGRAAVQEEAMRIGEAAGTLERALAGFNQQVGEELVALAIEVARQILRHEIKTQPDAILAVVREALLQLPHQHAAIYLNPEDAALVRAGLGETLTHAGHRIHEDVTVERGGCVLETGGSQVDASVGMRWRRVVENLGLNSAWEEPEDA